MGRISRNDVLADIYTSSDTKTGQGQVRHTYTRSYQNLGVDIQPIGGRVTAEIYGLKSFPANGKVMFFDSEKTIGFGDHVSVLATSEIFRVCGVSVWYSHKEAILEPHPVVLS